MASAETVEISGLQLGQGLAGDHDVAVARPQDAGEYVHERRLAAARAAEHEPVLALLRFPVADPQYVRAVVRVAKVAYEKHPERNLLIGEANGRRMALN